MMPSAASVLWRHFYTLLYCIIIERFFRYFILCPAILFSCRKLYNIDYLKMFHVKHFLFGMGSD